MATLKTIRKRIISVKNTQKITKAMKMVSAAKLRRAQTRLVNARPYAERMGELLSYVAALTPDHPLLQPREVATRAEFLILSSDRGLCGGFNGNLLRRIEDFLKTQTGGYQEIRVNVIGKKGRDFFKVRRRELTSVQTGLYDDFRLETSQKIASDLISGYQAERFDHFYLVYNRFKSAISQEIRIDRLFPVEPKELTGYIPPYLAEPPVKELLEQLIPRGLAALIHRAFLESMAAEFGARMAAMESATKNCREMIHRLTLQLNRLRQAAITKELMDIVNGAESLK